MGTCSQSARTPQFSSSPSNLGSFTHICHRGVKQSLFLLPLWPWNKPQLELATSLFLQHSTPTFYIMPPTPGRQKTATTRSSRSWISFSWRGSGRFHPQRLQPCFADWMFNAISHSKRHCNLTAIRVIHRILHAVHFQNYHSVIFCHASRSSQVFLLEFKSNL